MPGPTLTLELILLYTGLTGALVTRFDCTNETLYPGATVKCTCSTSSGALDWNINDTDTETSISVTFNRFDFNNKTRQGFNFAFFTTLNTSTLTFTLNQSEIIFIECANGNEADRKNVTVTDSGYNVKPPVILDTTFDPSGVTLHWKDPENTFTSTEYLIILYNITSNDTYNNYSSTTNTNLTINSTQLSLTANYAYTVKVMGRRIENSNISDPFTLATAQVNITINETNATDTCDNTCCANVTLTITLVSSNVPQHANQSYNVSYNSTNGNISVPECMNETGWCAHGLPRDNTYCFTIIPKNDYNFGVIKRRCVKITKYQCQSPPENGDGLSAGAIVGIVIGSIIAILICVAAKLIFHNI